MRKDNNMKRKFVHKPTEITAYEFKDDPKEITDVLEAINDYCGYDKYGWYLISEHEPPFLEIHDDEIDVRNILKGCFMTIDDEYGNISIFSHEEMFREWDLVEDNENS